MPLPTSVGQSAVDQNHVLDAVRMQCHHSRGLSSRISVQFEHVMPPDPARPACPLRDESFGDFPLFAAVIGRLLSGVGGQVSNPIGRQHAISHERFCIAARRFDAAISAHWAGAKETRLLVRRRHAKEMRARWQYDSCEATSTAGWWRRVARGPWPQSAGVPGPRAWEVNHGRMPHHYLHGMPQRGRTSAACGGSLTA